MNQTYTEDQRKQLHRLLDHAINLDASFTMNIHVKFKEDNDSLVKLLASTTSGQVAVERIPLDESPSNREYTVFSTDDVTLFSQEDKTRRYEQRQLRFDVV